MAIDKGNIKTSANYDVRAQKPMEARREKPRKVDLITKESWSYDGNTVYAHEGLQVWVVEEGKTYVLKDLSKMFEPDYSGWDEMLTASTGAGSDVIVDTELSDTSTNAIANSTVSRALADKQERLMDGVNIKTINGQNVLGRGNITIEGGSGGITEEKEVYIGSEEPPVGTKVWIDPTGTPSQPSQPSAGVEVIDNLESDSSTAALSANQGRVLKEYVDSTIAQGGGTSGNEEITIYILPYAEVVELEGLGLQMSTLPFYEQMCARNAYAYSRIVNNGISGISIFVDVHTYWAEFLKAAGASLSLVADSRNPANVSYSNFSLSFSKDILDAPQVQVSYANPRSSLIETFILHSDGRYEYTTVGDAEVYFGEPLSEGDITINKFVYNNWDTMKTRINYVGKRESANSSTDCPIMGFANKSIYILNQIDVTKSGTTFCRLDLSETGIPVVSPVEWQQL